MSEGIDNDVAREARTYENEKRTLQADNDREKQDMALRLTGGGVEMIFGDIERAAISSERHNTWLKRLWRRIKNVLNV